MLLLLTQPKEDTSVCDHELGPVTEHRGTIMQLSGSLTSNNSAPRWRPRGNHLFKRSENVTEAANKVF